MSELRRDELVMPRIPALERKIARRNIPALRKALVGARRSLKQLRDMPAGIIAGVDLSASHDSPANAFHEYRLEIESLFSQMELDVGTSPRKPVELFTPPTRLEFDPVIRSNDTMKAIARQKVHELARQMYPNHVAPSSIQIEKEITRPIARNLGLENEDNILDDLLKSGFSLIKRPEFYEVYVVKGFEEEYQRTTDEMVSTGLKMMHEKFSKGMFLRGQAKSLLDSVFLDFRQWDEDEANKFVSVVEYWEKETNDVIRTTRPDMRVGFKNGIRPDREAVYDRNDPNQYLIENHWLLMNGDPKELSELMTSYAKSLFLETMEEFGYATFEDMRRSYYYNMGVNVGIDPKRPRDMIRDLELDCIIRKAEPHEYAILGIRPGTKDAYVFRESDYVNPNAPSVNEVMDLISKTLQSKA